MIYILSLSLSLSLSKNYYMLKHNDNFTDTNRLSNGHYYPMFNDIHSLSLSKKF